MNREEFLELMSRIKRIEDRLDTARDETAGVLEFSDATYLVVQLMLVKMFGIPYNPERMPTELLDELKSQDPANAPENKEHP